MWGWRDMGEGGGVGWGVGMVSCKRVNILLILDS